MRKTAGAGGSTSFCRKHCGRQDQWRVSVDVLHRKSGSASPRRVFRAMLREMIEGRRPCPITTWRRDPGDILRVTPRDAVIEGGRPPHAGRLRPTRWRAT
jgi:plasmid replication initiation protein